MGAMSAYVDPDELMLFSVGMVLGVDTLEYMVDVVLDRRLSRADHASCRSPWSARAESCRSGSTRWFIW